MERVARKPLELPAWLQPDPGQKSWIEAALVTPTVCVAPGRRRGKTTAAKILHLEEGARKRGQYKAAYCAPTYKRSGTVYDEVCHDLKPLIARKRDSERIIELKPWGLNEGSKWFFWSLEEHDNLRGEGLDRADLDECCDVKEGAYYGTIRPMLLDRNGKATLWGTPKREGVGFVWFRREFYLGSSGNNPRWRAFSGSSLDNPRLTADAVEALRESYRDRPNEWREEILGEWLDDEGAVFEKLDKAFVLPAREDGRWCWRGEAAQPGVRYVIGFDIASHNDYCIFSVWRLDRSEQVELWRIRGEEYETVLGLLHGVRAAFNNATIYADGNGMGAPIVQRLAARYKDGVVDRKWSSNRLKTEDVTTARTLFQREGWRFLRVPWQEAEFRLYTRTPTANGLWKYHAPEGDNYHDDAVAAACMVADRVKDRSVPVVRAERRNLIEMRGGELTIAEDFFALREKQERRKRRLWPWNRG